MYSVQVSWKELKSGELPLFLPVWSTLCFRMSLVIILKRSVPKASQTPTVKWSQSISIIEISKWIFNNSSSLISTTQRVGESVQNPDVSQANNARQVPMAINVIKAPVKASKPWYQALLATWGNIFVKWLIFIIPPFEHMFVKWWFYNTFQQVDFKLESLEVSHLGELGGHWRFIASLVTGRNIGQPKPIYLPHRLDPTISTSQLRSCRKPQRNFYINRASSEHHLSLPPSRKATAHMWLQPRKQTICAQNLHFIRTHPKLNPLHRRLHIFSFNLHLRYPSIVVWRFLPLNSAPTSELPLGCPEAVRNFKRFKVGHVSRHPDPTSGAKSARSHCTGIPLIMTSILGLCCVTPTTTLPDPNCFRAT